MSGPNESIRNLIKTYDNQQIAEIRRSSDQRPRVSLRLQVDLSTARTVNNPYIVNAPFNSFYVESGLSAGVSSVAPIANIHFGDSTENYNMGQSTTIDVKSTGYFDTTQKGCALTWAAQANASLVIVFFIGARFDPGRKIVTLSAPVSITGGANIFTATLGALGTSASLAVTNAAAVQLCPINLNRTAFNFFTSQRIWVGDSAVAASRGTRVEPNSIFVHDNTGALWAIADAAAATVTGSEETL